MKIDEDVATIIKGTSEAKQKSGKGDDIVIEGVNDHEQVSDNRMSEDFDDIFDEIDLNVEKQGERVSNGYEDLGNLKSFVNGEKSGSSTKLETTTQADIATIVGVIGSGGPMGQMVKRMLHGIAQVLEPGEEPKKKKRDKDVPGVRVHDEMRGTDFDPSSGEDIKKRLTNILEQNRTPS